MREIIRHSFERKELEMISSNTLMSNCFSLSNIPNDQSLTRGGRTMECRFMASTNHLMPSSTPSLSINK